MVAAQSGLTGTNGMMSTIGDCSVTAIIPTYERPQLLARAIRSVQNQTHRELQILVLDNASSDETPDVVAKLARDDNRIRYHRHHHNVGLSENYQYGLKHVATPFFSFFADDDVLLPSFYENALQHFQRNPDAEFVVLGIIAADRSGRVLQSRPSSWKPGPYHPPDGFVEMVRNSFPTWTSIVFRRQVLDKIGVLDTELGAAIDQDFEYRAAARCSYVFDPTPAAVFTVNTQKSDDRDLLPVDPIDAKRARVIEKIERNEHLPPEARRYASNVLRARFRKKLLIHGFGHVRRYRLDEAAAVARALSGLHGARIKASLLWIGIGLARVLGPKVSHEALRVVRELWVMRRWLIKRSADNVATHSDIQRYIEHLQVSSQSDHQWDVRII